MEIIVIAVVQVIGLPLFGYVIYVLQRNHKTNKLQNFKITALVFAIQNNFDVNGFTDDYNECVEQLMKEHNFVHFNLPHFSSRITIKGIKS